MTEPTHPEPEDQIGYLLVRIAHTLSQHWTRDLAAYGLTARQHGVLATLAARPGVSAGALARNVMITAQSMGTFSPASRTVAWSCVTHLRDVGGPRAWPLTEQGHQILAAVQPITDAHNSPAALGLTEADTVHLRALLQQILTTTTTTDGVASARNAVGPGRGTTSHSRVPHAL